MRKRSWNFGSEHPKWKGDSVGYSSLHSWVKRRLGNPKKCEHCGTKGKYISWSYRGKIGKRWDIDWANKSRRYLRDLNDWVGLCVKCHRIFDKPYSVYRPTFAGREREVFMQAHLERMSKL